jgi:hypothetical protein
VPVSRQPADEEFMDEMNELIEMFPMVSQTVYGFLQTPDHFFIPSSH